MSLVDSIYQKNSDLFLKVFLEVDPYKDTITDFFYQGTLAPIHQNELEEVKLKVVNRTLDDVLSLKQSDFKILANQTKIHSLGLWLVHRAIDNFRGRDEVLKSHHRNLCLCFNVGIDELEERLKSLPDLELDQFVTATKATSACGGCKNTITKRMSAHRKALRRKVDSNGKWIQVKGMYPAELVLLLDESLRRWLKEQKIIHNLEAEIVDIEGYHIDINFTDGSGKKIENKEALNSLKSFLQNEHDLELFLNFTA